MARKIDLAQRINDAVHDGIVKPDFNGYTKVSVLGVTTDEEEVILRFELEITLFPDMSER